MRVFKYHVTQVYKVPNEILILVLKTQVQKYWSFSLHKGKLSVNLLSPQKPDPAWCCQPKVSGTCTSVGCTRKVNSTSLFRKSMTSQSSKTLFLVQTWSNWWAISRCLPGLSRKGCTANRHQGLVLLHTVDLGNRGDMKLPVEIQWILCWAACNLASWPSRCCWVHLCHTEGFGDYHCLEGCKAVRLQGCRERGKWVHHAWVVGHVPPHGSKHFKC